MTGNNIIQEYRDKVDDIDKQIIHLIGARFTLTDHIGRLKQELNLPIYDAEREKEVLKRWQQYGYEKVAKFLMSRSKDQQLEIIVNTNHS